MKKAVVLLSGGMDSTVLSYDLVQKQYNVTAISFMYGQRHRRELDCANITATRLGLDHIVLDISGAFKNVASGSALTNAGTELPKDHYTHENQKVTVVPNRNMIFLSFAIAVAEDRKIPEVYFAAHANDRAIYPDCRDPFVFYMSEAARSGTYGKIKVFAPYVHWAKKKVADHGTLLGVDYKNTWSCYEGGMEPCWTCATCQERMEAFGGEKI